LRLEQRTPPDSTGLSALRAVTAARWRVAVSLTIAMMVVIPKIAESKVIQQDIPDHYEVAITLNNLAGVHHAQGDADEAEKLYRRALALKEALLGPDHPDVAMTLNNLALLLADAGRADAAEPLYERALRTFAATLDPGHPKIRACVGNYAAMLRERGRGAAARTLERKYSHRGGANV